MADMGIFTRSIKSADAEIFPSGLEALPSPVPCCYNGAINA